MVEIKKLSGSKVEMKISVAWDEWKDSIEKAVGRFAKEMKIDGFRPGKAPRGIVEQKVGTRALLEEAAELAIQKTYPKILEKEKMDAIGSPRVEILKLAEGNDLEYKIVTAVIPEIKIKPWKDRIKKVNANFQNKKIEVTGEEIKKELEGIAASRTKFVTVRRAAGNGDNVILDFEVLRDGIVIENGAGKNHPLILGKGVFIPGFEENIVGMNENEEKEFELKFPDEYHEKNLAGKAATFKIKVKIVEERQIPEINDEFAKSLGKFENLEAFQKSVEEGIVKEKKQKQQEEKKKKYLDELMDLSETELPEILLHEEIHKMIQEFEGQLGMTGIKLENYLSRINKTRDDLENDWKSQAEKRVKSALVLEEIAKNESIKVTSEEAEAEMNRMMQYYKSIKEADKNIDLKKLYNYAQGSLTNEKVFEFLEKI